MTLEASKTVLTAIVHKNKQWSQWLAVFAATLSMFCAGVCFSWSSPSLAILQGPNTPYNITNDQASWIASLLPFGSALGPVFGCICAKYLGPKQTILTSSVPYLIGFVLIIFANSAEYLYVSRFISGISVGFSFTATPIYIGEIAEDHNRGALMILFMLMLGFGGTWMTCLGPYLSIQTMATLCCLVPITLLALMAYVPDSPYFLMKIGREDDARKSLKWLRRQKDDSAVAGELNLVRKSVETNVSFCESIMEIRSSPNPKALLIIFLLILAQQLCGALAVSFYQEQIYAASGIPMSPEQAVILSQAIGAAFGTAVIFFIDRWGRKPLLIVSSIGCVIANCMLGFYYQYFDVLDSYPNLKWFPILAMNLLGVAASIGLGPIPYTVLGEIFPSNFKEVAICIISVGGALVSFAVTKMFQVIQDDYGSAAVFFTLMACTMVLLVVNAIIMPETMNKSLLDIQKMLMTKPKKEEVKVIESYHITCKV